MLPLLRTAAYGGAVVAPSAQPASCTPFHSVTVGRTLMLVLIGGVALGVATPAVSTTAACALALALGSAAIGVDDKKRRRALVGAALAAAAAARGADARDRVLLAPLAAWVAADDARRSRPVVVEGVLVRDAERVDTGARLAIRVEMIDEGRTRHAIHGRALAYVGGDLVSALAQEWTAGRRVRATMALRHPPVWLNPGGPAEPWQALTRWHDVVGTVKSATLVGIADGWWWHEAAAAVRAHVRRAIVRLWQTDGDHTAGIVMAVLIGDRSGLDERVERRLQVAGTYHVIAISGGNVALFTAFVLLASRVVLRSFRLRLCLTLACVLGYGWVVGGDPSVSRAVTAATVYLACAMRGLRPAPIDVLGAVAVLVTLAVPLTVADAGAWLSFGASAGIVLSAGRLLTWYMTWRPFAGRLALFWLVGLFFATAAAELTLLPVSAALFHRVGVAGLALNFVAIPTIAVVQVAGAAGVVLVGWCDWAAAGAAWIARVAVDLLVRSSALVEVAPWLSWRVPPPWGPTIVCFYTTGLSWILWRGRRSGRQAVAAAFCACLIVVAWQPATALKKPAAGWLRLTAFDVGQGDSMLVQFPSGHALLVDAGGSGTRFDAGERLVTPAIWASGSRRLDWMAVTHADLDHIGGARAVMRAFRPREIWEGVPVLSDPRRRDLRIAAAEQGALWRLLQRGDRLDVGGVTLEVLHPRLPDWERPKVRNDDSLVLSVLYGDVEMLLTGDVGAETERALLDAQARRPLRVLKVAHHGSRSSTSTDLLRRYAPGLAVISAGRGNPFGHPVPEVLGRLQAAGARVFRTDRDGAVVIETDGREVMARTMSGGRWGMSVWRRGA
jgi:competence protein ComEC